MHASPVPHAPGAGRRWKTRKALRTSSSRAPRRPCDGCTWTRRNVCRRWKKSTPSTKRCEHTSRVHVGRAGAGGYSFVACLSHLTMDHASRSGRSTVPTPNRHLQHWGAHCFFSIQYIKNAVPIKVRFAVKRSFSVPTTVTLRCYQQATKLWHLLLIAPAPRLVSTKSR